MTNTLCSAPLASLRHFTTSHGKVVELEQTRCCEWWSTRMLAPIAFRGCMSSRAFAVAQAILRKEEDNVLRELFASQGFDLACGDLALCQDELRTNRTSWTNLDGLTVRVGQVVTVDVPFYGVRAEPARVVEFLAGRQPIRVKLADGRTFDLAGGRVRELQAD